MRAAFSRLKSRSMIVIVAAIAINVAPAGSPQPSARPLLLAGAQTDSPCWEYKPTERGFASSINTARVATGKSRLRLDPELSKTARKHTAEMVARSSLHHTSTADLKWRVTNWSTLGENVGVGASVDSLHTAFMGSPLHRQNVLYPDFRYVGVGVREADGRMWVTVIFEAAGNPGTRLRMPSCRR